MSKKPFLIIAVLIIIGGGFLAYRQFHKPSDFPPFDAGKSKLTVDPAVVAGINDLGFDLLAQLAKEKPNENIFISPPSVSTALTMAYNGARGETKKAMARVLGLKGMSLEAVNLANSSLIDVMENLDQKARCAVSNSLWAGRGLAFNPGFEKSMRAAYDAEFGPLDVAAINSWVNSETLGKIPKMLDGVDPSASLVLVNAVCFKGEWSRPFERRETRRAPFYLQNGSTKTIRMMHIEEECFDCYLGKDMKILRLPYGGGRLSMYFLLPAEGSDLSALRRRLSAAGLARSLKQLREQLIVVGVPRFKLEYGASLNEALSGLGIGIVFGAGADFSGACSSPGPISQVMQKTVIEVNEKGSDAWAASNAVITALVPGIIVDRPFFCAIRDDKTGLILFMGYIFDPKL